jgi:hypothetical protein
MEDCERLIKESLPKIEYCEQEYPLPNEGSDRISLRIADFKQSYDYTSVTYGQIYSYYAVLERIFKFELSLSKINSALPDALLLEDAIFNGLPFWSIDPEAQISKKRQQEATQAAMGKPSTVKLSEKVIEKIVNEKRTKVALAFEVVNLSATMGAILDRT